MKFLIKIFIIHLFYSATAFADEIKVFDFTESELSKLEVRKVRGADNTTIYSAGSNDKGNFFIKQERVFKK